MKARKPAAWADPDAEPTLFDMLRERGDLPALNEGTLATVASAVCDAWDIEDGPLMVRLGVLKERAVLVKAQLRAKRGAK